MMREKGGVDVGWGGGLMWDAGYGDDEGRGVLDRVLISVCLACPLRIQVSYFCDSFGYPLQYVALLRSCKLLLRSSPSS